MSEGSGSQRFCGNCGTELRSGTTFCVSCGIPANGGPASPGPDHSVPLPPISPQRSLADTLRETSSKVNGLFSKARSSSGGVTIGGLTNRGINWLRDLPSLPKLILVGLLLLLLLTVLSPVARIIAIIAFAVSAVVLVIRAIQRKPLRGWGITVVGSLLLIPVFGGVSGAIYGGGSGSDEVGRSESLYDASGSPDTTESDESDKFTPINETERDFENLLISEYGMGSQSQFDVWVEEPFTDEAGRILSAYNYECRWGGTKHINEDYYAGPMHLHQCQTKSY